MRTKKNGTATNGTSNGNISLNDLSIDPRAAIDNAMDGIQAQIMPAFNAAVRETATRMLALALQTCAQTMFDSLKGNSTGLGMEVVPSSNAVAPKQRALRTPGQRRGRPASSDGTSITEKIVAALIKAQRKAKGPVHHSAIKPKDVDADQVARNLQNLATGKRHGVVRKGDGKFAVDARELQ